MLEIGSLETQEKKMKKKRRKIIIKSSLLINSTFTSIISTRMTSFISFINLSIILESNCFMTSTSNHSHYSNSFDISQKKRDLSDSNMSQRFIETTPTK